MDERRRQLRRDMDSYISQRRKGDGWGFFKKPESRPVLHPAVQPYKKEESPVEQAPAQMESEYDKSKKGWFSGFVSKLFGDEEATIPQSEVQASMAPGHEETLTDLKEIARISLQVMKQMPGDVIRDFKTTPDYEKFKDILRKHKLIK